MYPVISRLTLLVSALTILFGGVNVAHAEVLSIPVNATKVTPDPAKCGEEEYEALIACATWIVQAVQPQPSADMPDTWAIYPGGGVAHVSEAGMCASRDTIDYCGGGINLSLQKMVSRIGGGTMPSLGAFVAVIAHELRHHRDVMRLNAEAKPDPLTGIRIEFGMPFEAYKSVGTHNVIAAELNADMYAGMILSRAGEAGLLLPEQVQVGLEMFAGLAHPEHGSGQDRFASALEGGELAHEGHTSEEYFTLPGR